jgi:hypothetical protein
MLFHIHSDIMKYENYITSEISKPIKPHITMVLYLQYNIVILKIIIRMIKLIGSR